MSDAMDHLRAGINALTLDKDDETRLAVIEELRDFLHAISPVKAQPVDRVRWVPIDSVSPNDYNPNAVARMEMQLLHRSIEADGYTQPVVVVPGDKPDTYVIVDGFHRYFIARNSADIRERQNGLLPVVVLDKSMNERMAATVRHNRARGRHSVDGMANMVYKMLDEGWGDVEICAELGMQAEELLRLKHVTGFSKLFEDVEYSRAWVSRSQARAAKLKEA